MSKKHASSDESIGDSVHRTRQEKEETMLGHLCKGLNYRGEQVMNFGRWKKVRAFSITLNADEDSLKGLISTGTSNLTDSSDISRSGRRMQPAPFPVTSSGIWDSTSPNVPGINSPQTNRDNIAKL